jgi:Holliday junction resolvasome RuvABC endonuclease subunit
MAYVDGSLDTIIPREAGDRRLVEIRGRILDALLWPGADLVVIEDFVVRSSAASVLGMLHGVIRAELIDQELPYLTVSPKSLKVYAAGNGTASKSDMRMALYKRTGSDVPDDNQADAAWLRLLALDLAGHPEVDLPQTHRRALDKLELPEGFGS